MDYSRLKTVLESNQERDIEERTKAEKAIKELEERLNARIEENDRKNAGKFTELFNSRNRTNETLTELATTMKMMLQNFDHQFDDLKERIDSLKGTH